MEGEDGENRGNRSNLPIEDPVETEDDEGNPYFMVPKNIEPDMCMHSIEVHEISLGLEKNTSFYYKSLYNR